MTFPRVIADTNAPDNRMRIGVVTSLAPLLVNVQGTNIPCGRAASFFPVVGDTVAIMRQDGTWMIMDHTQSPNDLTQKIQAGTVGMSVSAAASASVGVTFDRPFANPPVVVTNFGSSAGPTVGWSSRAIAPSEVGFTAFITGPSSTFSVTIGWIAQEATQ